MKSPPSHLTQSSRGICASITALIGCLMLNSTTQATDLPAVNLGSTTFYDGAPLPGGPGWYGSLFLNHYEARKITDNDGQRIGLPKSQVSVDTTTLQLIYQGEGGPLHSDWGFSALLPVVTRLQVDDGLNNAALDGQAGIADLNFGWYLQFKPIMGANGPIFAQRVELDFVAPLGRYERSTAINPGANFWSVNPYWAGTYWATPATTVSWRLHYLWNAKNTAPSPATYGAEVSDVQAGQAVHANFNVLYALTPQFKIGLNGYWLNQISDSRIDGHKASGRREKAFAIGPGAMYAFSAHDSVMANVYFETQSRNRPEGNRFNLRWIHKL